MMGSPGIILPLNDTPVEAMRIERISIPRTTHHLVMRTLAKVLAITPTSRELPYPRMVTCAVSSCNHSPMYSLLQRTSCGSQNRTDLFLVMSQTWYHSTIPLCVMGKDLHRPDGLRLSPPTPFRTQPLFSDALGLVVILVSATMTHSLYT